METTTLGGGCFWCLEAVFLKLNGVSKVVSGYAGGRVSSPTYPQVCTGTTGHAEVVQITFFPEQISFPEILEVFFSFHDPTTLNRQGADMGTQYRSVIFYSTEIQKEAAHCAIYKWGQKYDTPIVTEVAPLEIFYPAEEYHQKYYERNPHAGYCRGVIAPKIEKLQTLFSERVKK